MFPDVFSELDQGSTAPGRLGPREYQGRRPQTSRGIYAFETPQINGTIDLTEYRLRNTFDTPTTATGMKAAVYGHAQ